MANVRPLFLSRASNAFASLAMTVALAVLTILALAIGSMRDSKAEMTSSLLLVSRVEDPAIEWGAAAVVRALPVRSVEAEKPQVISRRPLSAASRLPRSREAGPSQEWMGGSKLAFPLLGNDLVVARPQAAPRVMTGQAVGVK